MRFLSIYKTAERNTPPTPEEMATFGKLIASEKGLRKHYKWLPLRHFKVLEKDRLRTRSGHSPLQTQRKCVARGSSAAHEARTKSTDDRDAHPEWKGPSHRRVFKLLPPEC
jgi:hypothetical protein